MTRYLALLGSVNVGGNRIKMVDLRTSLADAGYGEVQTIAASGNVVLSSDRSPAQLEADLAQFMSDTFGFDSCVMVRSKAEAQSAIIDNPFHGTGPEHGSDKMVHSIFLAGQPSKQAFETLFQEHKDRGAERLALGDRVLYLDYVHGVGVSDLTGRFIEKRLGFRGTARNMNSLKNILLKMD